MSGFENQWGSCPGDTFLKALVHRLTHPRDQCKSSTLKSTQVIHEGDSFVDLKASARGAEAC